MMYLQNLRLRIDLLSLQKVSPTVISPHNLQYLLTEIQSKLPSTLALIVDPIKDTWLFYKYLSCTALFN